MAERTTPSDQALTIEQWCCEQLRIARHVRGLTLREVEVLTGYSKSTIHQIERAHRPVSIAQFIHLANALNLNWAEALYRHLQAVHQGTPEATSWLTPLILPPGACAAVR